MTSAPTLVTEPEVRARLRLNAAELGLTGGHSRLWLGLSDGRVLAFWLSEATGTLAEGALISTLLAAVANDLRGNCCEIALPHAPDALACVLYAAPVLPLPVGTRHGGPLLTPEWQAFMACLDASVLGVLSAMERGVEGGNFFCSVRNYNRLVTLDAQRRQRRLQALARFPALVAGKLLTAHQSPNLHPGKRHAWREPDAAVEHAIDAGRDLTGALAAHYGISRGLVRSALFIRHWSAHTEFGRAHLRLLDALPANKRPRDAADFFQWRPWLHAYESLLDHDREDGSRPPAVQSRIDQAHAGAFREGWAATWRALEALGRPGDLIGDARDFLQAANQAAGWHLRMPRGPGAHRLAAGWLALYGLLGLVRASQAWHQRAARLLASKAAALRWPPVLGRVESEGCTAEELTDAAALAAEGERMSHCVGDYARHCLRGDRIFALSLPGGERATAQYRPLPATATPANEPDWPGVPAGFEDGDDLVDDAELDAPDAFDDAPHPDRGASPPTMTDDWRWHLVQLRMPRNAHPSAAALRWAREIASRLNAPQLQEATRSALHHVPEAATASADPDPLAAAQEQAAWFGARNTRPLARVLAWLGEPLADEATLLQAYVAGYDYHQGASVIDRMAAGDLLSLQPEPDNPHDTRALRLHWQGTMIGYVPREVNAPIHARLLAGESLVVTVQVIDPDAPSWRRIRFRIRTSALTPARATTAPRPSAR